ncbi:MAG TPA: hypothetical protein VI997_06955 [Candidatus Thermoplasmatota archaeon]|nr:hypothetical protein [Candidatus Thermoplasmatota archaeon]
MREQEDGYAGIPRWVKISGIVVLVLLLLFLGLKAFGVGGEHGPMRHLPSSGDGASTIGGYASPGRDHGTSGRLAEGARPIAVPVEASAIDPSIEGGMHHA